MRIDPNGLIGGCPALVVRKALRHLRVWDQWGVAELEAAAALPPGTGRDLVKALQTEGLIDASTSGAWSVTQAGRTFSVASAARPGSGAAGGVGAKELSTAGFSVVVLLGRGGDIRRKCAAFKELPAARAEFV